MNTVLLKFTHLSS